MTEVQSRLTTRTVCVKLPNGERQYWLTDQAFVQGGTFEQNGHVWLVSNVLEPRRSGGYLSVTLRDAVGTPAR